MVDHGSRGWYVSARLPMTRLIQHIRARLISGVLVLVPLAVTLKVLQILFRLVLGYVWPIARILPRDWLPEYVAGLVAFVILLGFLYVIGTLTRMMLGRRLMKWGESLLVRIPLVNSVYTWTKNLVDLLVRKEPRAFGQVVLVDFPYPGCHAIGFVGGVGTSEDGRRVVRVFLPTTPNPTSGYLLLLDEQKVKPLPISVEEALRLVVSGGILGPKQWDAAPSSPPQVHSSTGSGEVPPRSDEPAPSAS